MRINFRYGAAVGILAAAFAMLGPLAAQAGQNPGTQVPTGAAAISVQAPTAHLHSIAGKSVVLSSAFERSTWQRDNGIGAQREGNIVGNGQQQLGLPGQQDRMLAQTDRCNRGSDRCGCGYGRGGCCYGNGYGRGGCCGYGYTHGRCCGYGYGHGRCVSHYGA